MSDDFIPPPPRFQVGERIIRGAQGVANAVADTSRPWGVTVFAGWIAFYGGLYLILLLLSLCGLNLISQLFPPPAPAPTTTPGAPGLGGGPGGYPVTPPPAAGAPVALAMQLANFAAGPRVCSSWPRSRAVRAKALGLLVGRWS